MNKKEQIRKQREQQEDAALTKIIDWIVGAVVLEFLLLLLNRYYVNFRTVEHEIALAVRLQTVLPVLSVVFLALFAVFGLLTMRQRKAGGKGNLTGVLSAFMLMAGLSGIIAHLFYDVGIRFLYVAVPVVTVLALVYYLYQREFFTVACLSVLGILGVWMAGHQGTLVYVYAAVLAVILAAAAVTGRRLQTAKGKLMIHGRETVIFTAGANYTMLYVTCVVVAAVVLAALALGALPLLYGFLAGWLLVMAVYHTVRLM